MKIKSTLILLLIVASSKCYSQKSNQFKVYYSLTDSELLRNEDLDGVASYINSNSYEFGFKYLRKLSNKLSIEETSFKTESDNWKISPISIPSKVNVVSRSACVVLSQ